MSRILPSRAWVCVCEKQGEGDDRQLGGSTPPAVTGHRASGAFGMVSRAITHGTRALYWEGAQGMQRSSPEVQSELRLEEEPPVVRSAVDLGTWGDRWKQGGSGDQNGGENGPTRKGDSGHDREQTRGL